MQKKNMTVTRMVIEGIAFGLLLLLLWQLCYYVFVDVAGIWKAYSVPSISGVIESFLRLMKSGTLVMAVLQSLFNGLLGFLIACVLGVLLGLCLNHFAFLSRNLKPVLLGVQTLPSICWVPFAILWFGLSRNAIIFVVVMGSAFSIALAVDDAIRHIPPIYLRAAQTMGASPKDLYWKIILPASVPELVAGLKQGWSFAWRALMSGEVMASTVGLGQTLIIGRDMGDINQVMLVMLVIILVGVLIDKCFFSLIQKRILKKRGL